jgi:hypothetical protein
MDGEARGIHVWERMGVGGREEAEECRHVNGSRKLMKSSIFELECRNPVTYGQYVGNKREEVGLAEVRRVGERGGKRAAYQACKIKKGMGGGGGAPPSQALGRWGGLSLGERH